MRERINDSLQERVHKITENAIIRGAKRKRVRYFEKKIKDFLENEGTKNHKHNIYQATFNRYIIGKDVHSGGYFFEELVIDDGKPYWDRIEENHGQLIRTKLRIDGHLIDALTATRVDVRRALRKIDKIGEGNYR